MDRHRCPLSYTGSTNIVAYVDTQTGVPIDETVSQQVVVNVAAGSQNLSLIPVLALDFHVTPASVKYLAHKAKTSGQLLTLMKVIVPIVLIVIAVVLVLIAVIRRRKPVPAVPALSVHTADALRPQVSSVDAAPPR